MCIAFLLLVDVELIVLCDEQNLAHRVLAPRLAQTLFLTNITHRVLLLELNISQSTA